MHVPILFAALALLAATGTGFSAEVSVAVPPGVLSAMPRNVIEAGLKSHNRALYVKQGWIRDPFITLGPDDCYYLTGTTPNAGDPREQGEPYNTGLGRQSIVGSSVRVWRSRDLVAWEYLGEPFTLDRDSIRKPPGKLVWAPELHWLGDRWALIHCPKAKASFAVSAGAELKGPWTHPLGDKLGDKHDPSLFKDGQTWWMTWENGELAPLNRDLTDFAARPARIDPAGSRTNRSGTVKTAIGHEGTTLLKVGSKYVFIGTAWSTDEPRKGSYNLYYCTADQLTGPYGPRRFLGRFLGHGTLFRTRDGQWWCTAFFNANVPPLPCEGIERRDLAENAQTINQRGTTIVPLEVKTLPNGDAWLRALDPAYATPGPDEVQRFAD
jgi:xylan 1,4-beta-xylosidase